MSTGTGDPLLRWLRRLKAFAMPASLDKISSSLVIIDDLRIMTIASKPSGNTTNAGTAMEG